jgi:hypothetical protein
LWYAALVKGGFRMPTREDDPTKPLEVNVPGMVPARPLTNFQLTPENGGFNLILGARRMQFSEDSVIPKYETEIFAVAFLSHSMTKDLAKVLTQAVVHFEDVFGHIPLPGIDQPKVQLGQDSK